VGDIPGEAAAALNLANTLSRVGRKREGVDMMRVALDLRKRQVIAAEEALATMMTRETSASASGGRDAASAENSRAAYARRSLAEALRSEAAAKANLGTAVASFDDDAPAGGGNGGGGSGSGSNALDAIELFEDALSSLKKKARVVADAHDVELEIGLLLNLSNVNDNQHPDKVAGRAEAAARRGELADAMAKIPGGGRSLSTECAICLEAMSPFDGECGARVDGDGGGGDIRAKGDGRSITTLSCLHGYHTKCWDKVVGDKHAAACPECRKRQDLAASDARSGAARERVTVHA
jgi:hypothetical protein